MTDRELLELAARAAGYEVETFIPEANVLYIYNPSTGTGSNRFAPLTDDGDALRLAVKLLVEPHFVGDEVHCIVLEGTDIGEWEQTLSAEPFGTDINKATRRAIVRAAASIGEQMK